MRLTAETNPEAIKRYRHIKPASFWRTERCASVWPARHICTREKGHRGPHAAHGFLRRVVAVWESGGIVPRAQERVARAPTRTSFSDRPVGLRTMSPRGVLESLQGFVRRATSSSDEIAFVFLFAVFVWFALEILLLLY